MRGSKDCVELARETKVNEYYDMTVSDMDRLRDAYHGDPALMLIEAFKYGYLMGGRATRAEIKKGVKGMNAVMTKEQYLDKIMGEYVEMFGENVITIAQPGMTTDKLITLISEALRTGQPITEPVDPDRLKGGD